MLKNQLSIYCFFFASINIESISSQNRQHFSFGSMEDSIEKDNPVRVVEAFVEALELKTLHFAIADIKLDGRPSFNPKVFLKIYFYGYLNGIRSSRRLEKECKPIAGLFY